ncbi:MAG: TetR/AcrR family transcriptional regulator [Nocardioides sp.]|nr:TetR/AcrR family transcriptional regulator [Nocardioides sp.]
MTPAIGHDPAAARPRVEGVREQEVLDATLEVLADLGYDRLTMDSVATAARASKATLYRRWSTKASLVIDALLSQKGPMTIPDTGNLRDDLMQTFCGHGGLTDHRETAVFASVITAISRDTEFAEAFRRDFIGPKAAIGHQIFERARARGEIGPDVDIDLLAPALAGIVLHRLFLMGEQPTPDLVTKVIDQIILPAATGGR